MAMLTVPPFLEGVIGSAADVLEIEETTPSGSGALSYQSGWPAVTAMPLEAGGVAPQREYFNAVNKLLSQHTVFQQAGGLYPWDAALDYLTNAHVQGSDGEEYIAVAPSGPDVPAAGSGFVGAQDPTEDTANAYWISASAKFGAPVATQSVRGIARLATTAEVQAGAAAAGSVSPAVLRPEDIAAFPAALGGAMLYNTREVLTTSGSWNASVTGWMRGLLIAGGGGGGGGRKEGQNMAGGGGGGAGEELEFFFFVTAGQTISFTIGAGGVGGVGGDSVVTGTGTAGGDSTVTINGTTRTAQGGFPGRWGLDGAGKGGGSGLSAGASGGAPDNSYYNFAAIGGTGGGRGGGVMTYDRNNSVWEIIDPTGFGAGGCGGVGYTNVKNGGNGYQGCFVIDYFDPSKTA